MGQGESTPGFGYGLLSQESGRSAHQWSILGELGLSVTYEKSIGASRSFKVIKARYQPLQQSDVRQASADGSTNTLTSVLVVKVFAKANNTVSLKKYTRRLKNERDLFQNVHNVLVYQRILETEKAVYGLRQWASTSLYDRISTRPFLSVSEKKWIAYQLLTALQQCHELNIPHGDVKSENVLITSHLWVQLTDFASFKPALLPLNDPADFSFWFDSSGRRTCYIAPERFYAPDQNDDSAENRTVTEQMDIFSVGCVLAELFSDGAAPFSLSQMFRYRLGEFSVELENYLSQIEENSVANMIRSMLSLDPSQRKTFQQHLDNAVVFPPLLSDLHTYACRILESAQNETARDLQRQSDRAASRRSGPASTQQQMPQDIGLPVVESGHRKTPAVLTDADYRIVTMAQDWQYLSSLIGNALDMKPNCPPSDQHTPYFPLRMKIGRMYAEIPAKENSGLSMDDSAAIILLNLLTPCLRNALIPDNVITGLNMLLYLSTSLSDETNLDRVVPYAVYYLRNEVVTVRALAINVLTQILLRVKIITMSNAALFADYILPNTQHLATDIDPIVRIAYAMCLGPLAECSLRFLTMIDNIRLHHGKTAAAIDENAAGTGTEDSFDARLSELQNMFEEHVIPLLLTDTVPQVRKSLTHSIVQLCLFFGRSRASDILLSRMITFLNDKDWSLRSAFFESAIDFATCIGGRSLDDYILPLVDQALDDSEENVQWRVLASLKTLIELGFLKKDHLWRLSLPLCGLCCHPNAWVRRYAVECLCLAARQLSESDLWCVLYPRIRSVLSADIKTVEPASVQRSLLRPLPRNVYEAASDWYMKKSSDSLFWQQLVVPTADIMSVSGKKQPKPLRLSEEDAKQIDRLRALGLNKDSDFVLQILKGHLARNVASKQASNMRHDMVTLTAAPMGNVALQDHGIPTEMIFLNPHANKSQRLVPSDVAKLIGSPMSESYSENGASPIIMPTEATNAAQTTKRIDRQGVALSRVTPAVAEIKLSAAAGFVHSRSPSIDSPVIPFSTNSRGESVSSYTTYDGNNPYIRQLVDLTFTNHRETLTRESRSSHVRSGPLQRRGLRSTSITDKNHRIPQGLLVAHLAEHTMAVTHLSVSPDNLYFLSASEDYSVKIWDCTRVERNVIGRSRLTFHYKGRITCLYHLPHTHAFVCGTTDGVLHIQEVEVVTSGSLPKYGKQAPARVFVFDREQEYIACVAYTQKENKATLVCGTSSSELCLVDLETLQVVQRTRASRKYGAFTCVAVDDRQLWAAVGTDLGFLLLFDLRFGLLLKSMIISTRQNPILSCHIRPQKGKGRHVVACSKPDDVRKNTVEVWDISRGTLSEAFTLVKDDDDDASLEQHFRHSPSEDAAKTVDKKGKTRARMDDIELFLRRQEEAHDQQNADANPLPITYAVCFGTEKMEQDWSQKSTDHYNTAISSGELVSFPGDSLTYMVSGGSDLRLRFWDLTNIERSTVFSTPDEHSESVTFNSKTYTSMASPSQSNGESLKSVLHTEHLHKHESHRHRSTIIAQYQQSLLRAHHNTITAVQVLHLPYKAIVSADRMGVIKIFT